MITFSFPISSLLPRSESNTESEPHKELEVDVPSSFSLFPPLHTHTQTQNNNKVKKYRYGMHINLCFVSPLYPTLSFPRAHTCTFPFINDILLSCFPTDADIYAAESTKATSDFILELSRCYVYLLLLSDEIHTVLV